MVAASMVAWLFDDAPQHGTLQRRAARHASEGGGGGNSELATLPLAA